MLIQDGYKISSAPSALQEEYFSTSSKSSFWLANRTEQASRMQALHASLTQPGAFSSTAQYLKIIVLRMPDIFIP